MDNKDKYVSKKIKDAISESAVEALSNGKGNRAYGTTSGIEVGNEYTLMSINYRSEYLKPKTITNEEWNEMSDEEKEDAVGKKSEWFEFLTNNGPVSFGAMLGNIKMYANEYWADGETADDFDVTKLFKPSCRVPSAWIKQGVDDLIGKTIKCVGIKIDKSGTFETTVRAWVIE